MTKKVELLKLQKFEKEFYRVKYLCDTIEMIEVRSNLNDLKEFINTFIMINDKMKLKKIEKITVDQYL